MKLLKGLIALALSFTLYLKDLLKAFKGKQQSGITLVNAKIQQDMSRDQSPCS